MRPLKRLTAMLTKTCTLFIGALLFVGSTLTGCGGMIDGPMMQEEVPPPVPPGEHPMDPGPCQTGFFCFDAQFGSEVQPMTLGSKLTLNTAVLLSRQLMGQTVNFSVTTAVPATD